MRPARGMAIEVQKGLVVAVQVENHVVAARENHQMPLQALVRPARRRRFRHIRPVLDQVVGAVEVGPAVQVKASDMMQHDILVQADGIGLGHDAHAPLEAAGGFGLLQHQGQMMQHRRAGLLVRMQGSLQIGRRAHLRTLEVDDRKPVALKGRFTGNFLPPALDHDGRTPERFPTHQEYQIGRIGIKPYFDALPETAVCSRCGLLGRT